MQNNDLILIPYQYQEAVFFHKFSKCHFKTALHACSMQFKTPSIDNFQTNIFYIFFLISQTYFNAFSTPTPTNIYLQIFFRRWRVCKVYISY